MTLWKARQKHYVGHILVKKNTTKSSHNCNPWAFIAINTCLRVNYFIVIEYILTVGPCFPWQSTKSLWLFLGLIQRKSHIPQDIYDALNIHRKNVVQNNASACKEFTFPLNLPFKRVSQRCQMLHATKCLNWFIFEKEKDFVTSHFQVQCGYL